MTVNAAIAPGAAGSNVVGYLAGDEPGPIVVGAHHDGWFRAAFDNATGVAALIGDRPRARRGRPPPAPPDLLHLADRRGVGAAGPRVRLVHRRLAAGERDAPGVGRAGAVPSLPRGERPPRTCGSRLEAPVELTRWARAAGKVGEAEGWLTSGWRTSPPVTGTEQWPYLVAGVPGVATYNWETSFAKTAYHTPLDTPEIVDFDHLERLTRFYAYLLLDADRDPDGILDHRARARQLAKQADKLGAAGAPLAARRGARAAPRPRRVHRGGPRPARRRRRRRDRATARAGGRRRRGARGGARRARRRTTTGPPRAARQGRRERARAGALAGGVRATAPRNRRQHDDDSWAARSHLTDSPDLWAELASLRGEDGAEPAGPWLKTSLEQHLERSRADLDRRVGAMARALAPDTYPAGRACRDASASTGGTSSTSSATATGRSRSSCSTAAPGISFEYLRRLEQLAGDELTVLFYDQLGGGPLRPARRRPSLWRRRPLRGRARRRPRRVRARAHGAARPVVGRLPGAPVRARPPRPRPGPRALEHRRARSRSRSRRCRACASSSAPTATCG